MRKSILQRMHFLSLFYCCRYCFVFWNSCRSPIEYLMSCCQTIKCSGFQKWEFYCKKGKLYTWWEKTWNCQYLQISGPMHSGFTHALHDLASNAQTDTIGILKVLWSLDDCSPFPISYLMLRFSLYYSMVQRSIVPEGRQ